MVAGESLTDHTGTDNKMMLTKVRYINKKESVMCFCHLDEDDIEAERASSTSDGSCESDSDATKHSDTDSATESTSSSQPQKLLSKRKEDKMKRKSVRFMFDDQNCDASSTVSEPIKSVHTFKESEDESFLPPIHHETGNVLSSKLKDDSQAKFPTEPQQKWAGKRQPAVPDRMFNTLYSLSLSPRVRRKMSYETLSDIKKAIAESKQSIKKSTYSNKHAQQIHQRGLQSIPESGLIKAPGQSLPRRLVPVESPMAKSPLSILSETDAEQERLDFIKRALSPMSDGPATEAFRNRAATISGGEKRSWLIKRRNSREHVLTNKGLNGDKHDVLSIDFSSL